MPDAGTTRPLGLTLALVAVAVEEGIAIGAAYGLLGGAYARLARRVLDHAATHSLLRNEDDYAIDWNAPARVIRRFINAVGWPYQGARTRYRDQDIRIDAAVEIDDLAFPLRQPGKIWALVPGDDPAAGAVGADVVCGEEMLRILAARDADGRPVRFTSLRQRLGR